MNIFSEIYGIYYRIAEKILSREEISDREVNEIVGKYGFGESVIFLTKKIIPQRDGSDWGLLKRCEGKTLRRVTKNKPVSYITALQKSWILSILSDSKTGLFMGSEDIERLKKTLTKQGVRPLFDRRHFRYTDTFSDGDDFLSPVYRENFRKILDAVGKREVLMINYTTGKGDTFTGSFVPLKIEYSRKNDKFRVYCIRFRNFKDVGHGLINIGRINSVTDTGKQFRTKISLDDYFNSRLCTEPAVIKIKPQRNAIERFLMEFSSYKRLTEFNPETGECIVKLWYDIFDETEILIRLLGFGPVLEILSPPNLREQACQRIYRQHELLMRSGS